MNTRSVEVINQGLRCLSANLGARETEIFISTLLREKFDYTKWRQSFVDNIETFDDLDRLLSETKERSRYGGRAETMI